MTEWITDRLPTEADADEDGDVCVRNRPEAVPSGRPYFHWSMVLPGMAWCHTDIWEAPAKPLIEPAAEPRRFVSISRTDWTAEESDGYTLDAIADDGTAWWKHNYQLQWTQHTPLPDCEVPRF